MPEQAPARSSLLFSRDALLRLIIPLVIEQLLLMTVGMADTVMVTTSGEAAVSGVSLVDNINTLIIQVFSALSTGGAVVVSQYLGRQDTDNAKAASKQLLYAMCALSLLLMGAALVLRQHILALIFGRVEADVMENALVYFLLTATAYPFMGIYNARGRPVPGHGQQQGVHVLLPGCECNNITVNAVLIFGFGMGAAGAGIGTLVSRIAAAVIIMALLNHPDHVLRVEGLLRFEFRGAIVKRILFIGIPNGMENGMFQAGKLMVLNLITTFGTSAVAANAIANSVAGVINVPGMALGLAIITVIGQCMGAGETGAGGLLHQASRGGQLSLHAGHERRPLLLGWGTGHPVSPEPRGLHHGCPSAPACAVGNVLFWPLAFTLPNSLRAAGDAIFTMAVSLGSMFVCRVVLSYVFACAWGLNLGLLGVWLAMIADWVVRAAFFLFRYWRGRWKRIRVI